MSRPQRLKLKRGLAQAHHNIDRALASIQTVHTEFEGVHDDYAEALQIMAQHLIQVQAWMLGFWAKAWGKPPKDIDSYRG